MKLTFTYKIPDKPGFYWFCNFGEHTPVVLEVTRDYSTKRLWAQNEEFSFEVRETDREKVIKDNAEVGLIEPNEDGYYYGEQLWCYIPNPYLPGGKKQVEPDCY